MKKNMGNLDRIARVVVALIIAGLYFGQIISGTLATVLLVLGGIFVATSLVSFCPLYTLVGVSTCPVDKTSASS